MVDYSQKLSKEDYPYTSVIENMGVLEEITEGLEDFNEWLSEQNLFQDAKKDIIMYMIREIFKHQADAWNLTKMEVRYICDQFSRQNLGRKK